MTKDQVRSTEESLRLALEALHQIAEVSATDYEYQQWASEAITAIKAALLSRSDGEAKDEPVAWRIRCTDPMRDWVLMYRYPKTEEQFSNEEIQSLYTTPPQRTWVGLTDEHKEGLIYMTDPNPEPHHLRELIDVVEFQLKEKNK
jgi:hypothetical protein